ncbi:MAG TPA: hypothetical protein VHL09_00435, partial [Dehalococcoidia bacterium]|nr:hypothetical protein [Dehalococcoidia bacterium]
MSREIHPAGSVRRLCPGRVTDTAPDCAPARECPRYEWPGSKTSGPARSRLTSFGFDSARSYFEAAELEGLVEIEPGPNGEEVLFVRDEGL